MEKNVLEDIYHHHHKEHNRYGYLYCGGVRGPYLKQWIGQDKYVLDLGCRDGMLTQFFHESNHVIGVDIDSKALEMAKKRLGIETRWLDLNQEWPFEKNAFDVIVSCEIIEHLFLLDRFFDQIVQSLRPGGILIGSVPNAFRFRNRLRFLFGREFDSDPTHIRHFSFSRLSSLLQKHFVTHEIVPIQGKVLPFLKVSPHFPLAINRFFAKDLLWRAQKGE